MESQNPIDPGQIVNSPQPSNSTNSINPAPNDGAQSSQAPNQPSPQAQSPMQSQTPPQSQKPDPANPSSPPTETQTPISPVNTVPPTVPNQQTTSVQSESMVQQNDNVIPQKDPLLTKKTYPDDLDVSWHSWKCLNCGYVYEGQREVTVCPRCGNNDPDKFD